MGGTLNFKTLAGLFAAVLVLYLVVFQGIEYWRGKNGPWIVEFDTNHTGHPFLLLEHAKMDLHDLRLVFPEESTLATNLPARLTFDRPRQHLPFGRRLHEDLVKLPGVISLEVFGHAVELAPRRLAINGRALPWRSDQTIELWATNKAVQPLPPAESLQDAY